MAATKDIAKAALMAPAPATAQAVATVEPKTKTGVALLKDQLSKMGPEFAKALPGTISVDRFVRTAQTAIAFTRNIEKADPQSLMAACSKAAADGLILDGREAALVIDYKGEVQYRVMVGGKKKLLWNTGLVVGLTLAAAHENDQFDYILGDDERIVHTVDLRKDRGPVFAYYAIVKFKDGGAVRAVMTLAQVNAIRNRSDAWKAFAAGKITSTPWQTDPDEMGIKTVFHRLSKSLPKSNETAAFDRAMERDEEDFTFDDQADAAPPAGAPAPATKKRGGAAAAIKDITPDKDGEQRHTFTVPEGHVAVRDAQGRATGQTVPINGDGVVVEPGDEGYGDMIRDQGQPTQTREDF